MPFFTLLQHQNTAHSKSHCDVARIPRTTVRHSRGRCQSSTLSRAHLAVKRHHNSRKFTCFAHPQYKVPRDHWQLRARDVSRSVSFPVG
jgi:hypothetical protein